MSGGHAAARYPPERLLGASRSGMHGLCRTRRKAVQHSGAGGGNIRRALVLLRERQASADIRSDFPILARRVNGHPLVWLDNAATTQTRALWTLADYYSRCNSNAPVGIRWRARPRRRMRKPAQGGALIGATDRSEVVFVRGATEAINLRPQAGAGRI